MTSPQWVWEGRLIQLGGIKVQAAHTVFADIVAGGRAVGKVSLFYKMLGMTVLNSHLPFSRSFGCLVTTGKGRRLFLIHY